MTEKKVGVLEKEILAQEKLRDTRGAEYVALSWLVLPSRDACLVSPLMMRNRLGDSLEIMRAYDEAKEKLANMKSLYKSLARFAKVGRCVLVL